MINAGTLMNGPSCMHFDDLKIIFSVEFAVMLSLYVSVINNYKMIRTNGEVTHIK